MTIYTKKNVIHFRTPFLILFDAIYVKGIKSVVNVYVVLNYFFFMVRTFKNFRILISLSYLLIMPM